MIKNSSLILLFILVLGCNENDKPKPPDNLIAKEDMSNILYDLYIINAAKGVNKKLLETNGFVPETYVLTKYNIDSTQFENSNAYYAFDTETYKSIVDKVKTRLEKEKVEFDELLKIEGKTQKVKRDSISKRRKREKDSINAIKQLQKDSIKKSLDSLAIKQINS